MTKKPCLLVILALVAMLVVGTRAYAQTPNTSALIVAVTDDGGVPIPDAQISIASTAIGATREAKSGADGSATIAALPTGGPYAVKVTRDGFAGEGVTEVVLRAGETVTVR